MKKKPTKPKPKKRRGRQHDLRGATLRRLAVWCRTNAHLKVPLDWHTLADMHDEEAERSSGMR